MKKLMMSAAAFAMALGVAAASAEAKTKAFKSVMTSFEFGDLLLILSDKDENVIKSARNIPGVTVIPVDGLNVVDNLHEKYTELNPDNDKSDNE